MTLILAIKYHKEVGQELRLSLKSSLSIYRPTAENGLYTQFGSLIQLGTYRMNHILVNEFLGLTSLGFYDIFLKLGEMSFLITRAISQVMYPAISNEKDPVKIREYMFSKLKQIAIYAAVVFLGFLVSPYVLRPLFDVDFAGMEHGAIVFGIGIGLFQFSIILSNYFSGTGKHKVNTLASFIGFVTVSILGYITIPFTGIIGLVATQATAYALITIFQVWRFKIAVGENLAIKHNSCGFKFFGHGQT